MSNKKIALKFLIILLTISFALLAFIALFKLDLFKLKEVKVNNGKVVGTNSNTLGKDDKDKTIPKTIPNTVPVTKPTVKRGHIESSDSIAYDIDDVKKWILNPEAKDAPKEKLVFLTFDDGPSGRVTPLVLDELKKEGVHATFFTVGSEMKNREEIVKRTFEEGHEVAIHTNEHDYSFLYPNRVPNTNNILKDVGDAIKNVKSILGEKYEPTAYRYPGGHMSWRGLEKTDEELKKIGLKWIDWNSLTGDADNNNPDKSARGLYNYLLFTNKDYRTSNIIVVLMHDSGAKRTTAEALPRIIKHYKENGFKFGILK